MSEFTEEGKRQLAELDDQEREILRLAEQINPAITRMVRTAMQIAAMRAKVSTRMALEFCTEHYK